MWNESGLWAATNVILPLAAAALAACLVARRLKAAARDAAPQAADAAAPAAVLAVEETGVAAAESLGAGDDPFGDVEMPPLGTVARQLREELLARERAARRLGRNGHRATARILDLSDTGIRIGDGASMLRFGLEVLPTGRPAFRAETHCAVSDSSRTRFAPGATVNVRLDACGAHAAAPVHAP